jgi:hypothetical protein
MGGKWEGVNIEHSTLNVEGGRKRVYREGAEVAKGRGGRGEL